MLTYPAVYAGQEQHYSGGPSPLSREALWLSKYNQTTPLYRHIASLNKIRHYAISQGTNYTAYKNYVIYSDDNTLAMRKGYDGSQTVTVLSNLGTDGPSYVLNLTGTGFPAGAKLIDLLNCNIATVDTDGNVALAMQSGLPRVLYLFSLNAISGFCDPSATATILPSGAKTGTAATAPLGRPTGKKSEAAGLFMPRCIPILVFVVGMHWLGWIL